MATPDELDVEVFSRSVGTCTIWTGTPAAGAPLSSVTTIRIADVVLCALAVPLINSNAVAVMAKNDWTKREYFIMAPDN